MGALNDQEMEAVLGHELTHIRNGDVRLLVIAVVIAGVISFFGEMVFRLFFQNAFYGRRSSNGDKKGRRRGHRYRHCHPVPDRGCLGACRSSSASRCWPPAARVSRRFWLGRADGKTPTP